MRENGGEAATDTGTGAIVPSICDGRATFRCRKVAGGVQRGDRRAAAHAVRIAAHRMPSSRCDGVKGTRDGARAGAIVQCPCAPNRSCDDLDRVSPHDARRKPIRALVMPIAATTIEANPAAGVNARKSVRASSFIRPRRGKRLPMRSQVA
ncbi:hypothetical protein ACI2IY_20630 [Lysobacter enzymogenes]|uniref:hypothetical protein n=1 Tax=Lysobacter enzymogenes TaxID=69 RepID=UPI00384BAE21